MFLNALVKHTEHRVVLARQLRAAFRGPGSVDVAAGQLADLVGAVAPPALPLDGIDQGEGSAARSPVAPTNAVFFTTMCWHLPAPRAARRRRAFDGDRGPGARLSALPRVVPVARRGTLAHDVAPRASVLV